MIDMRQGFAYMRYQFWRTIDRYNDLMIQTSRRTFMRGLWHSREKALEADLASRMLLMIYPGAGGCSTPYSTIYFLYAITTCQGLYSHMPLITKRFCAT